jgi:L-lactate dehydrogenase complex protein LldF
MYRLVTKAAVRALGLYARGRGALSSLPFAGGWTAGRDLPMPERGGTFMARYAKSQRGRGR